VPLLPTAGPRAGDVPAVAPGVGLGWRKELAAPLFAAPSSVDFIEILAEPCFADGPLRREAMALAELWRGRVLPHGLRLSLGSADGIDPEHARRLGELCRVLRAPMVSEHVAFTRGPRKKNGRGPDAYTSIGHLTQLPLHRATIAVVARNVDKARRFLPDIPLVLETPAWTLRWPEDKMDEGAFFHELVRATGCDLLLDVANVYANACNSGQDPATLLRSYPLERAALIHLAGGAWREGFYVDTHGHGTPDEVFSLLQIVLQKAGPLPVLIERDVNYPPFVELLAEISAARRLLDEAATSPRPMRAGRPVATPPAVTQSEIDALITGQERLTELLTADEPQADTTPFDPAGIARGRSILLHKHRDELKAKAPRPTSAPRSAQAVRPVKRRFGWPFSLRWP
jgi:hypothetical protein